MITLFGFGPAFGLPDPSPFVTKADTLLKMSGLPYEKKSASMRKAPKGKIPYIADDGVVVPDSTLIRLHLEGKHGVDFDGHLSPHERGAAWAFEKMCEDHLYLALVHDRWMIDANFDRGPRLFFKKAPALIRPLIVRMIRAKVRKMLHAQGFGRYDDAEKALLVGRAFAAIADYLTDRDFIGGARPCAADASVFATVLGTLCPFFDGISRREAEKHPALVAYVARMQALYYPERA